MRSLGAFEEESISTLDHGSLVLGESSNSSLANRSVEGGGARRTWRNAKIQHEIIQHGWGK